MRFVEFISSCSKQVQQKKTKDLTVCEFDEDKGKKENGCSSKTRQEQRNETTR